MRDWYWWFSLTGGAARPFNAMHAVWCLALFVAALLFSTIYFIVLYKQAEADRIALCAEIRKQADFKTAGGRCP